MAGPGLGAEVEGYVAEVAAPTVVTLAGVGPPAGAVLAPGVDLALAAVRSCPPNPAPEREATVRSQWKNRWNARNGENNGTGLVIFSSARLLNPLMAMLIREP